MSAFDRLDPLVQHHIVNSLGWRSLRPLQEQCIEPILSGKHCLLLAPTAGGKTEATMFPAFSRMISERWTALSVIYICPLKALLNNLQQRLGHYAGLLGRRCEVWHGDIGGSRKNNIRATPPDILLTTPESLEGMLVSGNPLGREMLATVRLVVIDEVHAFAGDDRGWHLLSVLERVGRLAGRELQRIGLSATVGNPDELLGWMSGHCAGERRVVAPEFGAAVGTDVKLDFVGSLANAAVVISRLHRGEKRLVFCDSRSRVEELGGLLRGLGVDTHLSHSSLSVEERRSAEKAFAESRNCVIVSTSTLELGIDVGDLDRVIQIDSPNSVASFLQRLGRTGRRADRPRNCLFLATSERALLKAAALLDLWAAGFVEPITPPARPWHIFAQQLMALTLQTHGLGVRDSRDWIGRLEPFRRLKGDEEAAIIEYLKAHGILHEDSGLLGFGEEGELKFGRRHFQEILSVFTTAPILTVFHGVREIGTVEAGYLIRAQDKNPARIALAGRSWLVTAIDWRTRRITAEPCQEKGRAAWIGNGQGMSYRIASAAKAVLLSMAEPPIWSTRAKAALERLRGEFAFLKVDAHALVVVSKKESTEWYNFAGAALNEVLGAHFTSQFGLECEPGELAISFGTRADPQTVLQYIDSLDVDSIERNASFGDSAVEALKFHECLPASLAQDVLRSRLVKRAFLEELFTVRTAIVYAQASEESAHQDKI